MRLVWRNYDVSSNITDYIKPIFIKSIEREIDPTVGFTNIVDMRKMFITQKPSIIHNMFFKTQHFYQYLFVKKMRLDAFPGALPYIASIKFDISESA
jgi:hypothetical protein